MHITIRESYISFDNRSANKHQIKLIEREGDFVHVVMSEREPGYLTDQNTISINYSEVTSPQSFASPNDLEEYLLIAAQV